MLAVFVLVTTACAHRVAPVTAEAGPEDETAVGTALARMPNGYPAAAVQAVEENTDDVAAVVLDRQTGEYAESGPVDEQMYTASVVKVLVVADLVMRRGDRVSADERELLHRALSASDDEALNALWSMDGGSGAVERIAARAGMTDTHPPEDPAQWGETVSTARDMARLFGFVGSGLSPQHRDMLVDPMRHAADSAVDGFDQRFGLATQPGTAVKPGWMCCQEGRVTLHSAGFVDPEQRYVVVLMSHRPATNGYEGAREQLNTAAEETVDELR